MDADRIKGTARSAYGQVKQEYGAVAGDDLARLDGLQEQIEGEGQLHYGQAKDTLRDAADRASVYAQDAYEQGRRQLHRGAAAIEAQVETNPVMSILVACAAGYLIALAVRMSRR